MKPRVLNYLRVNDEPPALSDDRADKLPIKIDDLSEWFEFCKQLAQQRLWEYELLTIDFNFKEDPTGPWFPLPYQDPEVYNRDFLDDPALANLRWSDALSGIGPNSGLLIGAHLVSHAAYRDLPCGVGFHTYHPNMVIADMSSAMLATQIWLASGEPLPTTNLRETMRNVVEAIQEFARSSPSQRAQLFDCLETAVVRFRRSFLQRAGVFSGRNERPVRLWMEPSSLWLLLDIFRTAQTEEELNQKLQKFGIEFYDRNGALESLDLRSVFLDRLIYRDQLGTTHIRPRLLLSDVKPAGDGQPEPGIIWQFIETLAMNTPSNITPVLDFFRQSKTSDGEENKTINEAVKRKVHRLIALVFAWLDLYAERWFDAQSRSWDPYEEEFGGDYPTKTEQVNELLKIIDRAKEKGWLMDPLPGALKGRNFDPKVHFLPLSSKNFRSISALVREACLAGSLLSKPLRYGLADSTQSSQIRLGKLKHLVDEAVRWRCLEEELEAGGHGTGRYRLKQLEIPQQRPIKTVQADLARRLGFQVKGDDDASTQLKRIFHDTPGFEHVSVKDFLSSLEERPLPNHLKWLGWEFMDEFWGPPNMRSLPYEAWPVCLSETKGAGDEAISLVEWRRKVQRNQSAALQVQSAIMPSTLMLNEGSCWIQCRRLPAEEVGGDYYQVRPESHGRYRIYIGDVCGHGLPAALLVQEIHGLITVLQEQALSPDQLCTQLDSKLGKWQQNTADVAGPSNRWATFICADLDFSSNRLTYTNAGHPAPILVRKDSSFQKLDSQSRPVGMFPGDVYRYETIDLTLGDRLVFFTDGLSDSLEDQLIQCVLDNRQLGAKDISETLIQKVKPTDRLADDITLIVVSVD